MQRTKKKSPDGHSEGECPMTLAIGAISSKWAMPVLYNLLLAEAPVRFGVLKTSVGRITQRELSRTLKRFEQSGLVRRKVYAEVPLRVEYSLTALGCSLREPIMAFATWAERHARELLRRAG
jgi:DNA-binding HxlR family transcriptional regulator